MHGGGRIETPGTCAFNIHSIYISSYWSHAGEVHLYLNDIDVVKCVATIKAIGLELNVSVFV